VLTAELLLPFVARAVSLLKGLSEETGDGVGPLVALIFGFTGASTCTTAADEAELWAEGAPISLCSLFGVTVEGPESFSSRRLRICVVKHVSHLALPCNTYRLTWSIFSLSGASGVFEGGGGLLSMMMTGIGNSWYKVKVVVWLGRNVSLVDLTFKRRGGNQVEARRWTIRRNQTCSKLLFIINCL